MVATSSTVPSKTGFTMDYLQRNPKANIKAVNDAWTKSGNAGSVSNTLVSKLRRDLGLAGNLRARTKRTESNGANGAARAKASTTQARKTSKSVKAGRATSVKSKSTPTSTPAAPVRTSADRTRMLDEVEAGIDQLIFTLKVNGGLPAVEAALRSARRLLAQS